MIDLSGLAGILAAFFVAAASPGPATLALTTVSMSMGRRTGLIFATGLSAGLGFWGIVAASGLGALLQASTYALTLLKIFGGLYLIWLAINSCISAYRSAEVSSQPGVRDVGFRQGLMLNLSNPKAVFAWMAILAVGLGNNSNLSDVIIATLLCAALGHVIYLAYAITFSTSGAMAVYRKIRRWIEGIAAGLFALAGLGLLRSAFART